MVVKARWYFSGGVWISYVDQFVYRTYYEVRKINNDVAK